jgi:hypothetical protein
MSILRLHRTIWPRFFFRSERAESKRDARAGCYSSTSGAAGTSEPMTGVLVRIRLGFMKWSKAFSNPG